MQFCKSIVLKCQPILLYFKVWLRGHRIPIKRSNSLYSWTPRISFLLLIKLTFSRFPKLYNTAMEETWWKFNLVVSSYLSSVCNNNWDTLKKESYF